MKNALFAFGTMVILLTACPAPAEDLFFDSAGVRIRYIVEGEGEPVLLIHGLSLNLEMNWTQPGIVKELAEQYRVIAFDNRGHGKSVKPHDPKSYGMQMAEDAIRLMNHLKIRKAHVAGYSLGGRIATVLLVEHPDRLRTVTVGGAGWMDAQEAREREDLTVRLADSLEQGKGMGPLILSLSPKNAPPPSPGQIEAANKIILSMNDPLALAAVIRGTGLLQPSEAKLRANKLPVLICAGELDPRKANAESLAALTPNSRLVTIPNANHMTAFASPEFIHSFKAFLAEHAGR
jgi:pimeloyl-ACP methyl ester carboxylesterase